jgi:hypothetical protein
VSIECDAWTIKDDMTQVEEEESMCSRGSVESLQSMCSRDSFCSVHVASSIPVTTRTGIDDIDRSRCVRFGSDTVKGGHKGTTQGDDEQLT